MNNFRAGGAEVRSQALGNLKICFRFKFRSATKVYYVMVSPDHACTWHHIEALVRRKINIIGGDNLAIKTDDSEQYVDEFEIMNPNRVYVLYRSPSAKAPMRKCQVSGAVFSSEEDRITALCQNLSKEWKRELREHDRNELLSKPKHALGIPREFLLVSDDQSRSRSNCLDYGRGTHTSDDRMLLDGKLVEWSQRGGMPEDKFLCN